MGLLAYGEEGGGWARAAELWTGPGFGRKVERAWLAPACGRNCKAQRSTPLDCPSFSCHPTPPCRCVLGVWLALGGGGERDAAGGHVRCAALCIALLRSAALRCAVLLATAWPEAVAAHLLCLSRGHVEQPLLSITLVVGIMPPSLFPPACMHGSRPHPLPSPECSLCSIPSLAWPFSGCSCRRGDGPHPPAVPAYPWIHRRGRRLPLLAIGCVATDLRALVRGSLFPLQRLSPVQPARDRTSPAHCWGWVDLCALKHGAAPPVPPCAGSPTLACAPHPPAGLALSCSALFVLG